MLGVIFYFFMMGCFGLVLSSITPSLTGDGVIFIHVIYGVIFLIWGGIQTSTIMDSIRVHIEEFFSLDTLSKKKKVSIEEMKVYQTEMKDVLITTYRDFEQTMMQKVADSKIIATLLKESGYASVVKTYEHKIFNYLDSISSCDKRRAEIIQELKSRQSNVVSGYGLFIPKKFHYIDKEGDREMDN
jgi:hypothetical protein